jgi:hypothetical protein
MEVAAPKPPSKVGAWLHWKRENPMVAEIIPPTKTAGGRPPFTPPPAGTTYSQDPDDHRQDMLVHIQDSVDRLVRAAKGLEPDGVMLYLALLEQRRAWILGEMQAERLLELPTNPPLGIENDPYDLSALNWEFSNQRLQTYQRMLDLIDQTRDRLEGQLPDLKHDS